MAALQNHHRVSISSPSKIWLGEEGKGGGMVDNIHMLLCLVGIGDVDCPCSERVLLYPSPTISSRVTTSDHVQELPSERTKPNSQIGA